jgi:predicted peroxiredoxin
MREAHMKFVYWASSGMSDPTKASIPLHLAVNGSVVVGHDTSIILAGDAAEIVVGDNNETIEGVGLPPMRELLAKIKEHGVPVFV